MSKFESFCKNIHKTDAGYVPDLLDLVAQGFGDLCMAAYLSEFVGSLDAYSYIKGTEDHKNKVYSINESRCQDAIDAYNQKIDDEREAQADMDYLRNDPLQFLYDPQYKYARFNQAEIDAGFSGTGKEFC